MKNLLNLKKLYILLLFIVIAFIAYSSSINSSFQYDDFINIVYEPDIAITDLSLSSLKEAAFAKRAGFRPVSYLTLALNHYLSGEDTTSYHVVNIIIHVLNAFLIYLLLLRLFDYGSGDDESKKRLMLSALFTALIWLVTPLNSQSVIYIVQRMTSLMTLFFLLSFWCYIIGRKKRRALFYFLSGVCFMLSVLSKQSGIVLLMVIVLYELIFVRKGSLKGLSRRELYVLGAFALLIPLVLFAHKADIVQAFSEGYAIRDFTMAERLMTQPRVLIFYLSLLALPLPGRFSVLHHVEKSTSLFTPVTTFFSILLLVVALFIAITRMKKSPYLSFAILWFFITISVESSFLPLILSFEHRMYMPSIFLIGFFVDTVVCQFCIKRKELQKAAILLLCGLVALLTVFTWVRGKVWESELTLWKDVVENYPENGEAHSNVGRLYMRESKYIEAEPYVTKALEIKLKSPKVKYPYLFTETYYLLGITQLKQGKVREAEPNFLNSIANYDAEKHIFEGKYYHFSIVEAYADLGSTQYKLRKVKEAEKNLLHAISLDKNYSNTYYFLGILYLDQRNYDEAIKRFSEAAKLNPSDINSLLGLGKAYAAAKKYPESLNSFRRVLELNPANIPALNAVGVIHMNTGKYNDALEFFETALRHDPNDRIVRNNIDHVKQMLQK